MSLSCLSHSKGSVVLSLAHNRRIFHYKFDVNSARKYVSTAGKVFDDLSDIIAYYSDASQDEFPTCLRDVCPLPSSDLMDDDTA